MISIFMTDQFHLDPALPSMQQNHTFAYILPHLEMHVSIKIHTSSLQHRLFRYKPHHDPDDITMTSSEVVEDIMKLLHVLIL